MRNPIVTFALFFLTITLLSAQDKEDTERPVAELYNTTSYKVAIFPASYSGKLHNNPFKPTEKDVDKAEKALSRNLMTLNKERKNQTRAFVIHKQLMRFNRQYFAYKNENGEQIIWINAYFTERDHDKHAADFLVRKVTVPFGGSHYWNVKYNLTTDTLFDLMINDEGGSEINEKQNEDEGLSKKELKKQIKAKKKAKKHQKKELKKAEKKAKKEAEKQAEDND